MQIRALKTFSYLAGDTKVRVPRGLSVDLPDDAAQAAIDTGDAVAVEGAVPAAAPAANLSDVPDLDDMSHAELLALAEQRGVEVKKSDSKAVIAAAIKAKR
jgi:hypothetical protein